MNLIIIYGPPAAGKLTTALELAQLTGYKLFHNHLTVDLAKALFEFGTPPFFKFCDKLRFDTFKIAAKEQIDGLIFTFCYALPQDNKFIKRTIQIIESNGGQVFLVRLSCTREDLNQRVIAQSRKAFKKLDNVASLNSCLDQWDFFSNYPYREGLHINNSQLSPSTVALKIKDHFAL